MKNNSRFCCKNERMWRIMNFGETLKNLMKDLGISQTKLSELTGIGRSSISQYLSGKNEPSGERRRKMALALGVQEDYFELFDPVADISQDVCVNVPLPVAAKLMGKSREWVAQGLQEGIFPWGYAVKLSKWSYFISSVKFTEYTGIPVPVKQKEGTAVRYGTAGAGCTEGAGAGTGERI